MNETKPASTVPKGHFRCFQCRKAIPTKNGNWHSHQNQQVFLCEECEKKAAGAAPPPPKPAR